MTDNQFSFHFVANSGAEKRAISYASTIYNLFDTVLSNKQPADRVIGQYFKEHKKHGSKDRRVIRESLFGLFRWWGWIQHIGNYQSPATFLQMLTIAAQLESHTWHDIRAAWLEFSDISNNAEININMLLAQSQTQDNDDVTSKLAQFHSISSLTNVTIDQLLPDWFWLHCQVAPTDKQSFIQAMTSRPPIWARAQNRSTQEVIARLKQADIEATPSKYFSDTLNLGYNSINLNQVAAYTSGEIEIQDLASQVIGQTCHPQANSLWWDACSGAGGKSLQLYSLMQQAGAEGRIVASDIRRHALTELQKRAKRAGFKRIEVAPWQGDVLPVASNYFDGVLVDAPCSCTGTWRRNPDMRWIDEVNAISDKPALQLAILSRSAAAVKPLGELVYATCSLASVENEGVVNAFLQANPHFELETITHPFTQTQHSMLTVWPQQANSDGMFVAKMRRVK
ncbi:RsmB/NOP family class I SAM-dependent RNA methyltransferase [Shewanella aestuarii]|nr:RsmB/NOP family class I SAM-dependent RNA methyltransferase [Shewanella aestuarii]